MALFSQRKGIRPLKAFQREAIDNELRNRLWSVLDLSIWNKWLDPNLSDLVKRLVTKIWINFLKWPSDSMPSFAYDSKLALKEIRGWYFSDRDWSEIYDFIEYILKAEPRWNLTDILNGVLEAENSAYRIVGDEVTEITDQTEIEAIETALEKATKSVKSHIERALELLSDRANRDHRNSIKESISAVEAACRALSGKHNATLRDCINVINKDGKLHKAFEQALSKLYGYTDSVGKPPLETNLYRYAANNPVNKIDPLGLWYIDLNLSLGWWGGVTGGVLINPQGIWPYIGGGVMSPPGGLAITFSPDDPSCGWNIGGQFGYVGGFQGGYSFGSQETFWEAGLIPIPGFSLTGYHVWGPINRN